MLVMIVLRVVSICTPCVTIVYLYWSALPTVSLQLPWRPDLWDLRFGSRCGRHSIPWKYISYWWLDHGWGKTWTCLLLYVSTDLYLFFYCLIFVTVQDCFFFFFFLPYLNDFGLVFEQLARETVSFWSKGFTEEAAKKLENFGFIQLRPGGVFQSSFLCHELMSLMPLKAIEEAILIILYYRWVPWKQPRDVEAFTQSG